MKITLEQLQAEVSEWSHRNFPDNKPHHPLLGIVEEAGELDDAIENEAAEDAVADILIYAADYAGRNGLKLTAGDKELGHDLSGSIAQLCHYHLKGEQGIRYPADQIDGLKQDALESIVAALFENANETGIDAMAAVKKVWQKVKTRDWQRNNIDAAKIAEGK